MRAAVVLVLLTLLVLAPGAAGDVARADDQGRTWLFAHWPGSLQAAQEDGVPLDEVFPHEEPDLSEGPTLPGTSATGGVPTFEMHLRDWFGRQGPLGTLELDTSSPAVFRIHLSADQTPWPSPLGPPPQDVDHGVAPRVTVSVTLQAGDQVLGEGQTTRDLVSLPEPAGATVHTVDVPVELQGERMRAGEGMVLTVSLHQVDVRGERAMQSLFNVHTGEAYPTGLALPIENPSAIFLPDDVEDEPLTTTLHGLTVDHRETTRTVAGGALGAALVTMAVTGIQLVGWLRRS